MENIIKKASLQAIVILILTSFFNLSFSQSKLSFTLPFGKWKVGFKSFELYDNSRSVITTDSIGEKIIPGKPRPLQISVWYPADSTHSSIRIKYRDYIGLFAHPLHFSENSEQGQKKAENEFLTYNKYVMLATFGNGWYQTRLAALQVAGRREFEIITNAYLNVPYASGTFPVVIYAPGAFGPSFENDILMEYLASHGYIVVSCANWGPSNETQISREGLEVYTRDIEYLIGFSKSLPISDKNGVGIIGFSWGGLSNVVTASRNTNVSAIITYDGSIRYFYSKDYVQQALNQKMQYTTPSFFIDQGVTENSVIVKAGGDTGHHFFKSIKYADAYHLKMKTIGHQNFVAMYNRFSGVQPNFFISDSSIFNPAYETICIYSINFLNAYLKKDPSALSFLQSDPTKIPLPENKIEYLRKPGLRPLPMVESFKAFIKKDGLPQAQFLLAEIRKKDPDYILPEKDLSDWGRSLPEKEALVVFQICADLYPRSISALGDLGQAYINNHDNKNAIKCFERIIEIDPNNNYAKDKLQGLKMK